MFFVWGGDLFFLFICFNFIFVAVSMSGIFTMDLFATNNMYQWLVSFVYLVCIHAVQLSVTSLL